MGAEDTNIKSKTSMELVSSRPLAICPKSINYLRYKKLNQNANVIPEM